LEYEKFTSFCDKKLCLRKTFYNEKTCIRESKRQSCYKKYLNKQEEVFLKKTNINEEEQTFRESVWIRDYGSYPDNRVIKDWKNICRFWKILSNDEQNAVTENYGNEFYLNKNLEVAHIKGKGSNPEKSLKYSSDNAFLIGHVFHRLIDDFINPITKQAMSKEERESLLERIKNESK